jgi:serine-aspartate repeat-containing protein C/D/E
MNDESNSSNVENSTSDKEAPSPVVAPTTDKGDEGNKTDKADKDKSDKEKSEATKDASDKKKSDNKDKAKDKKLPKTGSDDNYNGVIGGGIASIMGAILAIFGIRSKKAKQQ